MTNATIAPTPAPMAPTTRAPKWALSNGSSQQQPQRPPPLLRRPIKLPVVAL
jgi:hypothetical protein